MNKKKVLSLQDYYPFGQLEPNRNFDAGSYVFGYQGSLKDDGIKGSGNSYTTKFRLLDVQRGQWDTRDKLFKKYPSWSPYNSMFDNPIWHNDQSGKGPKRRLRKYIYRHSIRGYKVTKGKKGSLSLSWASPGKNGVFININSKTFKNHFYDKVGKVVKHVEDKINNFMRSDPTGIGRINTGKGSTINHIMQGVAGTNPLISVPNAVKVLITGKDIYNQNATSTTDKTFAAAALIAPFIGPESSIGKTTAGEIINNTNTAAQFVNDAGWLNKLKKQQSDNK